MRRTVFLTRHSIGKIPQILPLKKIELFCCVTQAVASCIDAWLRFTSTSGTTAGFSLVWLLATTFHFRRWRRLNYGFTKPRKNPTWVCSVFTLDVTHPKTKPGRKPHNLERRHKMKPYTIKTLFADCVGFALFAVLLFLVWIATN